MIPRFATLEDADAITQICTDPEVRKWTAHDGAAPFNPTPWLSGRNMVVLVEGGCFLANWLGDGVYGVHTNIGPGARGRTALVSARLAFMLGFLGSPAETFTTMVPANNPQARWFTKAVGFRPTFTQNAKWLQGGELWNLDHFSLTIDEWILQGHLIPVGQAFHREVEALPGHIAHPEDLVHDAYVGAAVALINAGRPLKALKIYNRWALQTGYVPLRIASASPLVLDARDFLIRVEAGSMKLELKEYEHA